MNVTDVCNMALASLGKARIASLDEQSEAGRQCKLFYEYTKDRLLREYTWGFAKKVAELAELETVNPFWEHVYSYPTNCICVKRIFECYEDTDSDGNTRKYALTKPHSDEKEKYEIYMVSDNVRGIGCDVDNAWMEYIYDVPDLNVCSSDFIEVLVHMLAYNIALPLTGNMNLQNAAYNQAMAVLNRAKYTSAAEQEKKVERPEGYFAARF